MTQTHRQRGGRTSTPTYNSWRAMIARCWHPARRDFKWYGGRGIQVDPAWLVPPRGHGGFDQFVADLGPRLDGTTLDRIDVNGHYEPGNCRWATVAIQVSNRQPGGYAVHHAASEEAAELEYMIAQGLVLESEYTITPKWPDLVVREPVADNQEDEIPF